ncbi:hypothetical protein BOX15_Mlig020495g2 [Macrostomum lignano]|uniref:LIM zinc-binding domain-containing protein n=1 Tax=Macrostomum lignano TaxID=282301 RepID=A0A267EDZ1_9PLAT|nr:hypothetical protein BOX15_Mlig020495g2 [Macrostomum lignano]
MLSHAHYRLADTAAPAMQPENGTAAATELDEFGGGLNGAGGGGMTDPGPANGRHPAHHTAAVMSMSAGVAWCAGCGCQITEQFLLQAVDRCWHTRCLKCYQCGCALCDLGDSCYSRGGMILCRNDYLKMFGSQGTCFGCSSPISATEFVLRSHNKVYHVNCFVCSHCHSQLQPGTATPSPTACQSARVTSPRFLAHSSSSSRLGKRQPATSVAAARKSSQRRNNNNSNNSNNNNSSSQQPIRAGNCSQFASLLFPH